MKNIGYMIGSVIAVMILNYQGYIAKRVTLAWVLITVLI